MVDVVFSICFPYPHIFTLHLSLLETLQVPRVSEYPTVVLLQKRKVTQMPIYFSGMGNN